MKNVCQLTCFIVLSLVGVGCISAGAEDPVPDLDAVFYEDHVHAVVEPSCASLDCHGAAGRPLRIYSLTGLRAVGATNSDVLSGEEIAENVRSIAAVDLFASRSEDNLMLTKPLTESGGGFDHVGGDIWQTTSDDSYQCLLAFLDNNVSAQTRTICDRAAAAVAFPE